MVLNPTTQQHNTLEMVAMNLALWLLRTAQTQGDVPALAQGRVLTHNYQQLADAVALGAAWWQAQGLQAGDRVRTVHLKYIHS
jgi:hypothetical protein